MGDFVRHKKWLIDSVPMPRAWGGWGFSVTLINALASPTTVDGPHTGSVNFASREEAFQAGVAWGFARIDHGEV